MDALVHMFVSFILAVFASAVVFYLCGLSTMAWITGGCGVFLIVFLCVLWFIFDALTAL